LPSVRRKNDVAGDRFVSFPGEQCYAEEHKNPDNHWGCINFLPPMRYSANNNDNYYQSLIGLI